MGRRLVPWSALVALAAFLLALLGVVGSPASADPYTPAVPTSCRITVPATVDGDRVVVRVLVTAAGTVQPRGTVTVDGDRLSARSEREAARWTRTARYEGAQIEIVGPRLERGKHQASATFVPDDPSRFLRCSDQVTFQVGADETSGGGGGGGGAGLPNTGGPHLGFLLAGIGLVAVGGGLAERARRRT